MHRPTLVVGLFLILIMCLVPPFETGPVDNVADLLQGETVRKVEYHPIWSRPEVKENGIVDAVQDWEIAGTRLLLQILVVALGTGIVAYVFGSR